MLKYVLSAVLGVAILSNWAAAAPTVIVDEWGNGIFVPVPGVTLPIPTVAGPTLPTLTYALHVPTLVSGAIGLVESGATTQEPSDLILFRGPLLLFFSDPPQSNEIPGPADVGIPGGILVAGVFMEIGPEGSNYFDYTPGPGDPGFAIDPTGLPVTYRFVSDGVVPLPTSLALGAAGFGLVGIMRVIRRHRAA